MTHDHELWNESVRQRTDRTRRDQGHTQEEMASLLKSHFGAPQQLTQGTLSKILNGTTRKPSRAVREALHRYLTEFEAELPEVPEEAALPLSASEVAALRVKLFDDMTTRPASRLELKKWRQLAVWSGLPVDELTEELADLLDADG